MFNIDFIDTYKNNNLVTSKLLNNHNIIDHENIFKSIRENEQLVVQWLNNNIELYDHKTISDFFKLASLNGYIKIVEWLYYNWFIKYDDIQDKYNIMYDAFSYACKNNYLELAQLLYSFEQVNIEQAYYNASINGHLQIIKWLEYANKDRKPHYEAMINACQKGYLMMAQWIYKYYIFEHNDASFEFKLACYHNQIKMAQWLYTLPNIHVNIYRINKIPSDELLEEVFGLNYNDRKLFGEIINGNLEGIISAIYNGANYDMLNDFAFYKNCGKCSKRHEKKMKKIEYRINFSKKNTERIKIIEYLLTIEPRYYYEINENNEVIKYGKKQIFEKNARNK